MINTKGMFNLDNGIPESNLVEIYKYNNESLINKPLILDDEISIKLSSKFGELWEASPNNFMNLLSSKFNIPSGQFALQGSQIWQSTDPLDMSIKVNLEMDIDPYEDVINPAFILMQTCLPKIRKGTGLLSGEIVTEQLNLKLKSLIPPGPNIDTLIDLMKNTNSLGKNNKLLANNDGKNGVYNIKIGFATFYNMIITKVEPTFSKTMAKSSSLNKKGELYPSSVQLDIDIRSMEVATTDMMTQILETV